MIRLRNVALLLLATSALGGCSSEEKKPASVPQRSGECLVNSDCAAPLVCAFQRCHVECVTTRDCDGTLRCVGAHEESRVCQLEEEASCKTSADCVKGFVCGSDGACRDHCEADTECIGEQSCAQGVCAEPMELGDDGKLPQVLPQATCRLNSDCDAGYRCISGSCVAQCRTERDCAANQVCDAGQCRDVPAECQGDACDCACKEDIDCPTGETCDGCACKPGPRPECASAEDCEAGKQCVDGSCLCGCVEDRDCQSGFSCDGCVCQPPTTTTVIGDATISSDADLKLMHGITEVTGRLLLSDTNLTQITGLESLTSVGSLEIKSMSHLGGIDQSAESVLTGFPNLVTIRDHLLITNSHVSKLAFNPHLIIGRSVKIQATQLTCQALAPFEAALATTSFSGSYDTSFNGSCPGMCRQGNCYPVP